MKRFLATVLYIAIALISVPGRAADTPVNAPADIKGKILLVVSSTSVLHLKEGKSVPTGYFLSELAIPAQRLIAEGYEVEVATPDGNAPTMDAHSKDASLFGNDAAKLQQALVFVQTHPTMQKPLKLSEVVSSGLSGYAGVYVPGGHAPMNDLMQDASLGSALHYFHDNQKPTALLCHGPVAIIAAMPGAAAYRAALVAGAPAESSAKGWPYAGYRMTIFANSEELPVQAAVLKGNLEFLVADALRTAGGIVENGPDWQPFVVRDRELITGQNPASDHEIAEAIVKALKERTGT